MNTCNLWTLFIRIRKKSGSKFGEFLSFPWPNKVVRLPWFNNLMISSISLFWKWTSDFTILEFRSYRIKQNVVNEWMKQHWLLRSRSVTGHFAFLLLNYCFACCSKQLLFIAYIKNVSEIDYLHIFFVVVGMHKCLLWNMA